MFAENSRTSIAVDCIRCKRMDRGRQFTSGVSPIRNNMLGEQITVGQLTNRDAYTYHDDYYVI